MRILRYFIILLPTFLFPFIVNATSGVEYYTSWKYEDGTLTISFDSQHFFNDDMDYGWTKYKDEVTKIIIEDGVDFINNNSFQNFSNLEEVIFPDSMSAQISDYAFFNCPKLTKIDLPIGITRIGDYAFYGTGIKEVELPIFVGWIEEHSFNEDTNIIKLAERENIIASGTAGDLSNVYMADSTGKISGEGLPSENTCYNKYYYGRYYTDTAYWKLSEDGTLTVWGTDLAYGYTSSRVPWGCYKDQIKTMIFNDEKKGTLTKRDINNPELTLPGATYAVYTTKPLEEILNNRIKIIDGSQLWDCRDSDCNLGMRNIETIIVNRGTETIKKHAFDSREEPDLLNDFYISKYVKNIEQYAFFYIYKDLEKKIHLEVSYEDYINNDYNYFGLSNDTGFIKEVTDYNGYKNFKYATIINNINNNYVSINANFAPKTIEVEGTTYYLYETYITDQNGVSNISIPNDGNDYYLKEIIAPNGYNLDTRLHKIDMTEDELDIDVYNSETTKEESENGDQKGEQDEYPEKNPETGDDFFKVIIVCLITLELFCIIETKKNRV